MKEFLVIVFTVLILSPDTKSQAKFASVFTDNMILQQSSEVKVWGTAAPDETLVLSASWVKTKFQVKADANGKWLTKIKTPKAGFDPQSLVLQDSKSHTTTLNNILIGEVWLCSGQSNMEMVMLGQPEWNLFVENSDEEIAKANYPNIRFLTVGRKESFVPMEDIYSSGWKICTPENVKWASAVAYFFGKKIHAEMNVPVGLVVSSYGGSPVQSWIPEDRIGTQKLYQPEKENRDAELQVSAQTEDEYVKAMSDWITLAEKMVAPKKTEPVLLDLPVNLEKSKVGNQYGEVLFSKTIFVPETLSGKDLQISLGRMDDMGRVFFNGEQVWQEIRNSKSYSDIQFTIPAVRVNPGENRIEARVLNVLWGGGLTGPADKMYYTIGSEKHSLTGEWSYRKIFDISEVNPIPREGKPLFSTASSLYNGMIYPLLNFGFKGCLWYQGEGNVGDMRYAQMFTDMIASWRTSFNQELPFYFVQIAPYHYGDANGDQSVLIWQAQTEVAKNVPNTGMVITLDIGDANNIHPAKKKEVGERLANLALAETYGKKSPCRYPEIKSAKAKNGKVVLSFTNLYKGLVAVGNQHEFEISEDGKTFFPAQVEVNTDQIILMNQQANQPKYVRYCWRNAASGTIFNSERLPLSSFKTTVNIQE